MDQSLTVVVIDGFGTKGVDVHGLAGNEVFDATFDLWWTPRIVRTIPGSFTLVSDERCSTFRTAADELYRHRDDRALVDIDPHNLRDNLAAFLYVDIIADVQVEALDEVLVVQGGTLDGCASQLNRIHIRHRGNGTRAPHLIGYLIQPCTYTFGLELIGDGPTRALRCESKRTLLPQGVHFQDDTIGSHGQVLTFRIPVVDVVIYLLKGLHLLHALGDFEAPVTSHLQILKVSFGWQFLA